MEPDQELDRLAHTVIGAAVEVHRTLGPGFLESVYESALTIELELRGVAVERQKPVSLMYKGRSVGDARPDLLVEGALVVELKAVECLAPIHKAQVISYLKALRLPLGLLMNFNVRLLKDGIERVIFTQG